MILLPFIVSDRCTKACRPPGLLYWLHGLGACCHCRHGALTAGCSPMTSILMSPTMASNCRFIISWESHMPVLHELDNRTVPLWLESHMPVLHGLDWLTSYEAPHGVPQGSVLGLVLLSVTSFTNITPRQISHQSNYRFIRINVTTQYTLSLKQERVGEESMFSPKLSHDYSMTSLPSGAASRAPSTQGQSSTWSITCTTAFVASMSAWTICALFTRMRAPLSSLITCTHSFASVLKRYRRFSSMHLE